MSREPSVTVASFLPGLLVVLVAIHLALTLAGGSRRTESRSARGRRRRHKLGFASGATTYKTSTVAPVGDSTRVALVGGRIEDTVDSPILVPGLRAAGLDVDMVSWRDAAVRWSNYDLVLLRSCWDHVEDVAAFLEWARRVDACARLLNPLELVAWNVDKHYLIELSMSGHPVVPSVVFEVGERGFRDLDAAVAYGEIVVKPTVGAGSRMAARYGRTEYHLAIAHVVELHRRGQAALIQPYIASVDTEGEVGVYVFGGVATHMISKSRALTPGTDPRDDFSLVLTQEVEIRPFEPALASFAEALVRDLPSPALYARVDVVQGSDGPLLLELELIDPVMFLDRLPATIADSVITTIASHARQVLDAGR